VGAVVAVHQAAETVANFEKHVLTASPNPMVRSSVVEVDALSGAEAPTPAEEVALTPTSCRARDDGIGPAVRGRR
jgi:hypothetical protein